MQDSRKRTGKVEKVIQSNVIVYCPINTTTYILNVWLFIRLYNVFRLSMSAIVRYGVGIQNG